ncbi:hypothetical protein MUG84_07440 [Paenibacillus sp. KQZ6P-2]|uniref:Uncharacterized protein n=1 Tax=Paenibacillus mangrovi TaxID=2931978 RepID=A0A9X2B4F2_9BACL|nr:hypothetical protein [Paenibacillus mangrovi]MCJ8011582.1 hypothetical protein [Paenibacillus mangrovi]
MARQTTKWIVGLSSIALFTGLLYVEGVTRDQAQYDSMGSINKQTMNVGNGVDPSNNEVQQDTNQKDSSNGEQQDTNQKDSSIGDQQSGKISGLNGDQSELSIPSGSYSPTTRRSHLRTRRS